jgi:hypothetical protein
MTHTYPALTNGRLIAQGPFEDEQTTMIFFELSFWADGEHRDNAEVVASAIVAPAPVYAELMQSDTVQSVLASFLSHVCHETIKEMFARHRSVTDIILVDPKGHDTDTMQVDFGDELPF